VMPAQMTDAHDGYAERHRVLSRPVHTTAFVAGTRNGTPQS
jgi:hypothetical protein